MKRNYLATARELSYGQKSTEDAPAEKTATIEGLYEITVREENSGLWRMRFAGDASNASATVYVHMDADGWEIVETECWPHGNFSAADFEAVARLRIHRAWSEMVNRAMAEGVAQSEAIRSEITLADRVAWIEETNVVTVSTEDELPAMEFTTPDSPIIPMAVVTGRFDDDVFQVKAEAGPGQTVSEDTLLAYEVVVLRRIRQNTAARVAKVQETRMAALQDRAYKAAIRACDNYDQQEGVAR